MSDMHRIDVSEEDLLSLDGKCPQSIQDIIDKIHTRNQASMIYGLTYGLEPHLAAVLHNWLEQESKDKEQGVGGGKCSFWTSQGSYCSVCGKQSSYETYKRGSYRHAKGSPNYDKPLYLSFINLSFSHGDNIRMCYDCYGKVKAAKAAFEATQNG